MTVVKEYSIPFSDQMVRAIMRDRTPKSQTRRVIPAEWWRCLDPDDPDDRERAANVMSPYGPVGSRLWVRETWRLTGGPESASPPGPWVIYRSHYETSSRDEPQALYQRFGLDACGRKKITGAQWDQAMASSKAGCNWRLPRFMFRWASRLLLEKVAERIEPLQEISEEDAIAELGLEEIAGGVWTGLPGDMPDTRDPLKCFTEGWDRINARAPFASNPLVRVVTFRLVGPA